MTWQDDYYAGSSDYPLHEDDEHAIALDPWADTSPENRTEELS